MAGDLSLRIGTAGWTIPASAAAHLPQEGSSLKRYAARFDCAEINSSFHRSHRPATWARWAASVPEGFRFSCKLPKEITHARKLVACEDRIAEAVTEIGQLAEKLAVLLVQLPPSLGFDAGVATLFFDALRRHWRGAVACEPRHSSWLAPEADSLLAGFEAARVAADPARSEGFAEPGGWRGLAYFRLHGSPVMYRSSYDDGRLESYAAALRRQAGQGRDCWCIFDNTASGAALADALRLQQLLG